ncbi:MAG TPA: tetratricopeptide repeat protein [Caulobacteraceae bacterium]
MRMSPRLLLTTALAAPLAALTLAGCATTGSAPGSVAAAPGEDTTAVSRGYLGASNYGLFLAGEAAFQAGRSQDAADYFSRATEGAGDLPPDTQAMIREKAFTAAVMAGDVDRAAALAPAADPDGGSGTQRLARLVRAVDALSDNKGKDADAILNAPGKGSAYAVGINLLKPWAAAGAGDAKRSALPIDGPTPALTRVAGQFGRALLLERAKRFDEAEADYKALTAGQFAALYIIPYSEFLERRGRWDDAKTLLKDAVQHNPGSREFHRALDHVSAARRPAPAVLPTLRQGAAQALTAAAEMSLIEKRFTDGQIYLRLSLRLDPQENEAWVFLGDILAQSDDHEAARAAYMKVPASSPDWVDARERIIASYQAQDDLDTAIKMAEELVKVAPDDRDALVVQADLYRAANRFPDAVKVLDKLIAQDPAGADWAIYYERGTALDRAGRWPEAEKDLQKALMLRPDQPDVLNYLGYSWVTRGERLQQAIGMLQKAYLAQPNSGEIADSLGWAYYNMGDFKQAVQRLERAVALEPVNAEINDHLGDAYWRAGRKTEAQYQWNRVLTLMPAAELKTAVEHKLSSGLEPAPPAVALRG